MRNYVLPHLGYSKKYRMWINESFPDPKYRVILDEDVGKHYTILSTKLIATVGINAFNRLIGR